MHPDCRPRQGQLARGYELTLDPPEESEAKIVGQTRIEGPFPNRAGRFPPRFKKRPQDIDGIIGLVNVGRPGDRVPQNVPESACSRKQCEIPHPVKSALQSPRQWDLTDRFVEICEVDK